uniref:Phosphatidylethanolamine binding protein 4 n=1 Tax=Pavo cristatus TaxID=9049 RepID=A0A8C9L9R7_PAVCR
MGLLAAVLLAALLPGTAWGAQALWPDEPSRICSFQSLGGKDSEFCRGNLEVIYPELGDVGCTYIPTCHQSRWRISREWGSPQVRYPQADKSKKYVVVLVDPDAPSRADPRSRFWRHWLLTDVPGAELRTGELRGRVLTEVNVVPGRAPNQCKKKRSTPAPRRRPAVGTTATSCACTSSPRANTSAWVPRSASLWAPGHCRASWSAFGSAPPWPRRSSSPNTTRIRGARTPRRSQPPPTPKSLCAAPLWGSPCTPKVPRLDASLLAGLNPRASAGTLHPALSSPDVTKRWHWAAVWEPPWLHPRSSLGKQNRN